MMKLFTCTRVCVFVACAAVAAGLNCMEDNTETQKCYTDNGLQPPVAGTSTSSSRTVDGVENLNEYCQNKEVMRKAYRCSMQITYDCVASDPDLGSYSDYVPSPNRTDEYVDIACRNLTVWKQDCVGNLLDELERCIESKVNSMKLTDIGEALCAGFDQGMVCTSSLLKSCGCATVKLLTDILRGPANPPGCGTPDFEAVQCDPEDPLKFMGSGVADVRVHSPLSMLAFIFVSCAVLYLI